jgi:L-fuconolactonase
LVTSNSRGAIIDTHLSLPGTPDDVEGAASELRPLLAEHHVEHAVAVVDVSTASDSQDDSQEALRVITALDLVSAAVVAVDLTAEDVGDRLDRLAQNPKVRGLFVPVEREPDNHWLVRDDVLRGLRAAAERGLSADVLVAPRQLPSVGRLAEAVPELRIALDRLGSPFIAKSQREPWGVYVLNVAPHRNVVAKLSGLVALDTQPEWRMAHIRLFVEAIVRLFGYDRMMFGSGWPEHTSSEGYGEVLEATIGAAGPMTGEQQERLLRGTAGEFYRID